LYPILEHLQPVFFSSWDAASFTAVRNNYQNYGSYVLTIFSDRKAEDKTSLRVRFVSGLPKHVHFATFAQNLLAVFTLWFGTSRDKDMQLPQHLLLDQPTD